MLCLFALVLNVQVNNFSVMSGRSRCFLGTTSIFRGVIISCIPDREIRCFTLSVRNVLSHTGASLVLWFSKERSFGSFKIFSKTTCFRH